MSPTSLVATIHWASICEFDFSDGIVFKCHLIMFNQTPITMKKPIMIVGLIAFAISAMMAQTDYQQWEVMGITPKADKLDLFKKGLGAHNKKYHATDPYKVSIVSVLTGPNSGQFTWLMGPCTWTQLDARMTKGEHDGDWDKTVAPNIESYGEVSYWRLDKDINYQAANATTFTKARLRFYTVIPGEGDRLTDLFKKVAEVYKKKQYAASYNVYRRQGASAGPSVVVSLNFAKWSFFDSPNSLMKDYEEMYGANSWNRFLDDFALCIDRSKTYDELNELVPELSSN